MRGRDVVSQRSSPSRPAASDGDAATPANAPASVRDSGRAAGRVRRRGASSCARGCAAGTGCATSRQRPSARPAPARPASSAARQSGPAGSTPAPPAHAPRRRRRPRLRPPSGLQRGAGAQHAAVPSHTRSEPRPNGRRSPASARCCAPCQRQQPEGRQSEPAQTHDEYENVKTTGSDCSGSERPGWRQSRPIAKKSEDSLTLHDQRHARSTIAATFFSLLRPCRLLTSPISARFFGGGPRVPARRGRRHAARPRRSADRGSRRWRDALDRLTAQSFDVVFCDIAMPQLNGPGLMAELARRGDPGLRATAPARVWMTAQDADILDSHQRLAESSACVPSRAEQSRWSRPSWPASWPRPRTAMAHGRTRQRPTMPPCSPPYPMASASCSEPQFALATDRLAGPRRCAAGAIPRWATCRRTISSPGLEMLERRRPHPLPGD